jgi:transposase
MKTKYPSDISLEQFERIRSILESARKKTKPRKINLHDAFCGVLYVLKTGCQWRALPHEYPKWRTVYSYFEIWNEERTFKRKRQPSILDEVLKKNGWRGAQKPWERREN